MEHAESSDEVQYSLIKSTSIHMLYMYKYFFKNRKRPTYMYIPKGQKYNIVLCIGLAPDHPFLFPCLFGNERLHVYIKFGENTHVHVHNI